MTLTSRTAIPNTVISATMGYFSHSHSVSSVLSGLPPFLLLPATRNLFNALSIYIYMTQLACMFLFFSRLSFPCNPSPLLPRYHSSSPCKLSFAEPQRTLLPVELRILYFFQYACLYVPSFFKALPFLHFMPFFHTFSCVFLRFFKSFLPAISSFSQRFPQFSLPFIFSSILMVFSTCSSIFLNFLQPFATPSSVSLLIPLQTVFRRTPTDAALR